MNHGTCFVCGLENKPGSMCAGNSEFPSGESHPVCSSCGKTSYEGSRCRRNPWVTHTHRNAAPLPTFGHQVPQS
jgi:hypothetical protein